MTPAPGETRSVHDTLDRMDKLHGQPVQVEGILGSTYETANWGYELLHYPNAERRAGSEGGLWLEFGNGSVQPNRPVLARWVGKRVRVHGIAYFAEQLHTLHDGVALSDPSSIWPVYLEVYSVQRVTSEQRKQHGAA